MANADLTVFSWTDAQTDGFDEKFIATVSNNGYNEIDLSDEQAEKLMLTIQQRLQDNEHITLRFSEGD